MLSVVEAAGVEVSLVFAHTHTAGNMRRGIKFSCCEEAQRLCSQEALFTRPLRLMIQEAPYSLPPAHSGRAESHTLRIGQDGYTVTSRILCIITTFTLLKLLPPGLVCPELPDMN